MSYFPHLPNSTDVPEEVFFGILKYLHPGATWLFCRRVSRSWKVHVDCNIERYIKHHASVLASEPTRLKWIGCFGVGCGHLIEQLADSLSVEVRWAECRSWSHLSSLTLRFKEIELPSNDGERDSDKWDEKITFEGESLAVYGSELSISRINHFMFPAFSPAIPEEMSMSEPLKVGTHRVNVGDYDVEYTLTPLPNDLSGVSALQIHTIMIPVRSIMTFSTPHTLYKRSKVLSGSTSKVCYLNPSSVLSPRNAAFFRRIPLLIVRRKDTNGAWSQSVRCAAWTLPWMSVVSCLAVRFLMLERDVAVFMWVTEAQYQGKY